MSDIVLYGMARGKIGECQYSLQVTTVTTVTQTLSSIKKWGQNTPFQCPTTNGICINLKLFLTLARSQCLQSVGGPPLHTSLHISEGESVSKSNYGHLLRSPASFRFVVVGGVFIFFDVAVAIVYLCPSKCAEIRNTRNTFRYVTDSRRSFRSMSRTDVSSFSPSCCPL